MSSTPSLWDRVKTGGKVGFDKTWKAVDKLGAPVNRYTNKIGSEAFWPTTLDKESDKAARILRSFCKDGFYREEEMQPTDGPKQKQKVLKKIPQSVIKNAKGIAIFTTMRSGLWFSGAGGSGILVGRQPDGQWSPPSGIMLHTAGLGFLVGIDIYDCVVVINNQDALNAFTKVRCTLGGEISATAGPVGMGGVVDSEVHKRQAPIFTYMKSRGFYAGVQIDGTIVIERTDENERFYGEKIGVVDILAGKARHPPKHDLRRLWETLRAAQGDTDVDETLVPDGAPPGDYDVDDGHVFGVPNVDDPDPYGVLALEKEGMGVVEAGTRKRASWEQFQFHPSPTSPVHTMHNRLSTDNSRRGSWRNSAMTSVLRNGDLAGHEAKTSSSLRGSMEVHRPGYANSATQTDEEGGVSPIRPSFASTTTSRSSMSSSRKGAMQDVPENEVLDHKVSPTANGYSTPPRTPRTPPTIELRDAEVPAADNPGEPQPMQHGDEREHADEEEVVVHSVQTVQPIRQVSAQSVQKATIVSVPKRGPPPRLPPRNPNRKGSSAFLRGSMADTTDEATRTSRSPSPLRDHTTANSKPQPLNGDLESVDVDEDLDSRDPWANVQQKRVASNGSGKMPGGFD